MKFEVFLTLLLTGNCLCSNDKTGTRLKKKLTLDETGAEIRSSTPSKDKNAQSPKEGYPSKKEGRSNLPSSGGLAHFSQDENASESGSTKPPKSALIQSTKESHCSRRNGKRTSSSPSGSVDFIDPKHSRSSEHSKTKQVQTSEKGSSSSSNEKTKCYGLIKNLMSKLSPMSTSMLPTMQSTNDDSNGVSKKGKEKVESEKSKYKVDVARYAAPDRGWYISKWGKAVEIMEKLVDKDEKGHTKMSNKELTGIVKAVASRRRSKLEIEEPKETEEEVNHFLKKENSIFVIAREKEKVVGMIVGMMSVYSEHWWDNHIIIRYLFVHEKFVDTGVAEEMVKILKKRSENCGQIKDITKFTGFSENAVGLFEKFGFEKYFFSPGKLDFELRIKTTPLSLQQ